LFSTVFSTVISTEFNQLELSFSHSFSSSLRLAFVAVVVVVVVVVFLHRHSPFVLVQSSHRTSVVVGVGVFKRAHLALLQTLDLAFQKPTTKTTQR
jgi:Na+/serine symporter